MKLTKMICFTLLAAMPFAALATRSSSVPLTGGTALPNQEVVIAGDKLYENVFYNVTCNVRMNSSQSDEESSHIQVGPYFSGQVEVNFEPVQDNGQSRITLNEDNSLVVRGFRDYSSIQIRNLDHDNSLTLSNCVATPST